MRKFYLDNLRWLIILILFPYHTLIIYTGMVSYYFNAANNVFATGFILTFAPWFMQLLFAIAGVATFYSLRKRDSMQYLKERVSKLLIPMIAGIILVIPFSTYFGFLSNGYSGSFISLWFIIMTNWLNYLGTGLLVGPLWFLMYLFIISLVALPIFIKYKNSKWRIPVEKVTVPKLILLVVPLAVGSFLLVWSDKSIVQFFLLFIFGYFLLSDEGIQKKLEDKRWPLFISFLLLTILYVATALIGANSTGNIVNTPMSPLYLILMVIMVKVVTNLILWLGVLGIIGMGKHYLEFKNSTTLYLSAVSFPIYIFHIVWINMFAYYFIRMLPNMIVLQVILIMILSFIMTIVTIEVLSRISVTRFLFGIKK